MDSLGEEENNNYKGSNRETNALDMAIVMAMAILIIVMEKEPYKKRNILFIRRRNTN